jgi:WD40 repeat protein
MKLSADRKWLALEQRPTAKNQGAGAPAQTFDVGIFEPIPVHHATIPSCSQLLDVASGGKAVAVVREKKVELWDVATAKVLKSAPFKHTRPGAAAFSPNGKVLALSDQSGLVLWWWEEGTHERIDLGRGVGSLAFSPDGRFLAEGPAPGNSIRIWDLETRKVVRALAGGTGRPMNVPRLVYTQGGRVLIACDNFPSVKGIAVPHRIYLWDTASGSLAHGIALPADSPFGIEVSPNGRYLAALLDDGDSGKKLSVWRLDGQQPVTEEGPQPPAAGRPR